MNDEIPIREYERRQLHDEFFDDIVDLYIEKGMDERARAFGDLLTTFDEPHGADEPTQTYDLGGETWSDIATALDELDEGRALWLSSKIARRADLAPYKMGFTTDVPIGTLMTM